MAYNGSGTFSRPVADYTFDTVIDETAVNTEMAGIATGLSTAITKDGQTTVTANLPMAGFRHTGVGNASARTMYLAAGQLQDGGVNWVDGGGTADALTAAYSPAVTTVVDGMLLGVRATAANATTTPTFSPNGLTARTITKNGDIALAAGDIVGDGHELLLRYRASDTKWELLNPLGGVVAASDTVAGKVELATIAETETGTDATRAVTPDGLHDMTTLSGAAWFLDEDTMSSDSAVKTASQQSVKAYVDGKARIRQIVQATKTDTFTTTNTTYTDITGVSVSITPSSTSSKILIMCFGAWGMTTAGLGAHITLVRGSTEIIRGDAASSRVRATVGGDTPQDGQINQFGITYLDSPASVSALTYKLQIRAGSGGTACIGRAGADTDNADSSRVPTVIIVMEFL